MSKHTSKKGLAVSDGELNSSGSRGSNNSVSSLPSSQSATHSLGQSVARWAVSFETLLQDRLGVAYFTEFLKKEFSAENVYFWQACERFQQIPASSTQQLTQEARRIYDEFLSSHSVSPVNIDRQAWIGEEMLAAPTPDMFHIQQLQIFNLMKFDSYARFVKSPLYQACVRAESQGQPLPELRPHSRSSSPPSDHGKKTKLKPGKSLPLGVEAAGNSGNRSPRRSFRKSDHRERHWGEQRSEWPSLWRESQGSLNSSASLDLGFLSSCATSSSQTETPRKSLTGSESDNQNQPVKYCCIYLPDGTASLVPARPGLSIQEMLSGICQRRGFHLPDVKLYLVGNDKKPLALNQDSAVLMDQEVKLETRVSFELEITCINKTVRIVAKATKHLREALKPIVEKYGLDVTRVLLRRPGELHAIDLEEKVSMVASQKLVLESDTEMKPAGVSHAVRSPSRGQSEDDSSVETESEAESLSETHCSFTRPARSNQNRHSCDLEGLVELLNRAQSCRVNDQRGILSKEDLVLPDFLQLPGQDGVSYESSSSFKTGLEKKCTPGPPISRGQSQEQSETEAFTLKISSSSKPDLEKKSTPGAPISRGQSQEQSKTEASPSKISSSSKADLEKKSTPGAPISHAQSQKQLESEVSTLKISSSKPNLEKCTPGLPISCSQSQEQSETEASTLKITSSKANLEKKSIPVASVSPGHSQEQSEAEASTLKTSSSKPDLEKKCTPGASVSGSGQSQEQSEAEASTSKFSSSSKPDLEKKCTPGAPVSRSQSQEQSENEASTLKQNTGHPSSPPAAGKATAM